MPHKYQSSKEVIELLECYLETAKTLPFGHVAISMVGHPNIAATDYAGEISLELSQKEGMGILQAKLQESIDAWTLPPRDETLDASHVCYNLANGPLGFDFLIWLITAEMTRVRENAPAPLKVAFFLGKDYGDRLNRDMRKELLANVFRPALKLIGAVEDPAALPGRCGKVFVTREIVAAARTGERVPLLHSSHNGPDGDYMTITLREASHWPERNSDIGAWVRFARYLQSQQQRVIFVRDTAKALDPIEGFETSPPASLDLDARLAVYQQARMNFFVSNGPAVLCAFSHAPWLMFVSPGEDADPYGPNRRQFWRDSHGVPVGEQYPWSASNQRLVWQKDSYENILAAWEGLASVAKAA